MKIEVERRLLQAATALACMVPLSMGAESVMEGPQVLRGAVPPFPIDLESHFAYLSGLLLGIGLVFLVSIPRIERASPVFRALGAIVVVGGLARLGSLFTDGVPSHGHQFGLAMELVTVPLIVLWQASLARRWPDRPSPSNS